MKPYHHHIVDIYSNQLSKPFLIWQIHCSPAPVTCAASFPRIFRNCAKPIKNLQSICLFNQQPFSSCFTIQFLSGLVA